MEEEIAWQEKEIASMKATQQNAVGAIATEYSATTFSFNVSKGITQKTVTFTPNIQSDYIYLSVAGYHDASMTNPIETFTAGIFSLGYVANSVMITSYQTQKSGNTFRLRLTILTMKEDSPIVYLKATAMGERTGTFTIS